MSPSSSSHNVDPLLGFAEQALSNGPLSNTHDRTALPFALRELGSKRPEPLGLDMAPDAPVALRIELGRARLAADQVELRSGAIVALDRQAADAVELFAGERLVALGELVVIDGRFCVRITQQVAARIAA